MEIITQPNADAVAKYLAELIDAKLAAGQKVLWLVPGGSAIKIAAKTSKRLRQPLNNLTVTLTDERYGRVGHKDSNWPQLQAAGFHLQGATLQPVLLGKNLTLTTKDYSQMLQTDIKNTDYSLALAGMGPDGHIFGIKPGSPAIDTNQTVVGYDWEDYVRITPTPKFIKQLDEVVVYAVGQEKWPQFESLKKNLDPSEQPAQLLKQLKKAIIFSDYKGDRL